jgi:hypothetical protein
LCLKKTFSILKVGTGRSISSSKKRGERNYYNKEEEGVGWNEREKEKNNVS